MKRIKGFQVKNINWCVEEEDVMDELGENPSTTEIEAATSEIKSQLPKSQFIDFQSDNLTEIKEKADTLADILSDEHGYLVESFSFEIIDENNKKIEISE